PNAPEATLLVLDATTGQNALVQAREFQKAAHVTGLVLAKIDGTAKGGSVFPIVRELKVPILFLGSGEHLDDIDPFDARAFVDALLQTKYASNQLARPTPIQTSPRDCPRGSGPDRLAGGNLRFDRCTRATGDRCSCA